MPLFLSDSPTPLPFSFSLFFSLARSLVHRVLMDLSRPRLLISRSPWNFYQFLSSDVPRSSFLKFPEDPGDSSSLFLRCTPYCLFMGLPPHPPSTLSFPLFARFLFLYLHSFHSLCPLIFSSSFLFLSLSFPPCQRDRPLSPPFKPFILTSALSLPLFPHSPRLLVSL